MLSDSQLRSRFVAALDEVSPPAPWLNYAIRTSFVEAGRRRISPQVQLGVRIGLRIAAVVALVILVSAVIAGLLVQHRTVPNPIPASPRAGFGMQWRDGGMIDRDVGWTLVFVTYGDGYSDRVLRTTDGGHSWKVVTPPGVALSVGSVVKAGAFIDRDHAAVTVRRAYIGVYDGDVGTSQLVTYRTADGGATWQIGTPAAAPAVLGFQIMTSFVDPLNGWLLYTDQKRGDVLYRTNDGGMHWVLLATNPPPIGGSGAYCFNWCRVQFASLTRGWIGSDNPAANQSGLFVTGDGGRTWKPQSLPLGQVDLHCPCGQDLPHLVDDMHGFVTRAATDTNANSPRQPVDRLVLFATDDGGASWTVRPLPGAGQMWIGFRDAEHGWVVAAPASELPFFVGLSDARTLPLPLYVTSDGGRTWTPVPTKQPLQSSAGLLTDLYFVDDTTAFGWVFHSECVPSSENAARCGGPTSPPDTGTLLRSDDGGQTWKPVWVAEYS